MGNQFFRKSYLEKQEILQIYFQVVMRTSNYVT